LTDITDTIAGLAPDTRVFRLRRERADILADTQGVYDALFHPEDPGHLASAERLAMGLRVARLENDAVLAAHFRAELADSPALIALAEGGAPPDDRAAALMRHADLVTRNPDRADAAHLAVLRGLGFDERDIVAATQLVAFVTFHIRVLAGLRLLQEEPA
jgi:uncharacterized protein YciW